MQIMSTIAKCPMKKTLMAVGIVAATAGAIALPKAIKCETDPKYKQEVFEKNHDCNFVRDEVAISDAIAKRTLAMDSLLNLKEQKGELTDEEREKFDDLDYERRCIQKYGKSSSFDWDDTEDFHIKEYSDRLKGYIAPKSYTEVSYNGLSGIPENIEQICLNGRTAMGNVNTEAVNSFNETVYTMDTNPYAAGGALAGGLALTTLLGLAARKEYEEQQANNQKNVENKQ